MATLDDILGGSPPPDGGGHAPKGSLDWVEQNSRNNAGGSRGSTPQKGSQQWAEQNSGDNAPVTSPATPSPTKPKPATPPTKAKPEPAKPEPISTSDNKAKVDGVLSYEDLYKRLNPYIPPTEDELKKQKRAKIIAAIGDGVTALANLYFASQYAPSMYDGKHTLSTANKVRYDKLLKDREEKSAAYYNGLIRARQADAENAHRERSWQRQLGLDQEARDRYKDSITHRNERERIADERYTSEQEYRRGRDKESDRRSDRNYNFQVQQHNDNVKVRREQADATRARAVRGKQIGFADGSGNQVAIYENVWKGSMQSIYDTLVADGITPTELQLSEGMSARDKEDFVKQNWYKSDKARAQMLALSKLDPATMSSEISEDNDDFESYRTDEEEDFEQYKQN